MSAQASVAAIVDALAASGLLVAAPRGVQDLLRGVTDDSRRVVPGGLFLAVRGTTQDGHRFIPAARAAGAALVLAEDRALATGGPAIIVREGRRAAAIAAAAYYGFPARRLRLAAVTGTNGKTTTVGMIRHLMDDAEPGGRGHAASIGTLGVLLGSAGERIDAGAGLTTPGPVDLQRILHLLVDRGVASVAMEVSSHSLAQHRVEGVEFDAAVFTNLTRDHLDYHGTMDAYLEAKLALADKLAADGVPVVNADDRAWDALPGGRRRVTFSMTGNANVAARDVQFAPNGTSFRLVVSGEAPISVHLPLIGDFNVANALGAAGAAIAMGIPVATVAERLSRMPQVPGRLELVGERPTVLRDYAHTPDALERALTAVRPFVKGRLIAVFGAGGDRDPGKRPLMGAAAAAHADVVIVTSDNPRTEDPEKIIDAIVAAMPDGAYERIEDRRAAIRRAIAVADPERDVILLAGKGHEDYQIRGTEKLPFDESVIVPEILRERTAL